MGNSTFWFYPSPPADALVEIDTGMVINDMLVPSLDLRQASATAFDNTRTIVQWGARGVSRIRMRWSGTSTAGRALRRQLVAMLNHMDRGGSIMFAVDKDEFYAGFLTGAFGSGATTISIVASTSSIAPAATPTNEELVLRSANPRCLIESQLAGSSSIVAGGIHTIAVSPGLYYDYADEAWVLVRELGSWPALRLPDNERGRQHLTSEHETVFELDLPVEEDDVALQAQFDAGPSSPEYNGVKGTSDPVLPPPSGSGWTL